MVFEMYVFQFLAFLHLQFDIFNIFNNVYSNLPMIKDPEPENKNTTTFTPNKKLLCFFSRINCEGDGNNGSENLSHINNKN